MNIMKISLFTGVMCILYTFDAFANDVTIPISTNEIHSFEFDKINNECDELEISGYMVGHYHGLPTKPTIVNVEDRSCKINGLFFNMPGIWKILVSRGNEKILSYSFDAI